MGPNGECRRLERFLNHYGRDTWPVVVIENGSDPETCKRASGKYGIEIINLQPHLKRGYPIGGTNHNYPSIWRAYWSVKELLNRFERVFYVATDARVVSQRLMNWMLSIESGWATLWSAEYQCAASEIQVITRDCVAFENFFAGPCNPDKYNGLHEERVLPFTHIEKGFVGDRYGEFMPAPPFIDYNRRMDYYTQTPDSMEFDDTQFPVIRPVDGRVVVA